MFLRFPSKNDTLCSLFWRPSRGTWSPQCHWESLEERTAVGEAASFHECRCLAICGVGTARSGPCEARGWGGEEGGDTSGPSATPLLPGGAPGLPRLSLQAAPFPSVTGFVRPRTRGQARWGRGRPQGSGSHPLAPALGSSRLSNQPCSVHFLPEKGEPGAQRPVPGRALLLLSPETGPRREGGPGALPGHGLHRPALHVLPAIVTKQPHWPRHLLHPSTEGVRVRVREDPSGCPVVRACPPCHPAGPRAPRELLDPPPPAPPAPPLPSAPLLCRTAPTSPAGSRAVSKPEPRPDLTAPRRRDLGSACVLTCSRARSPCPPSSCDSPAVCSPASLDGRSALVHLVSAGVLPAAGRTGLPSPDLLLGWDGAPGGGGAAGVTQAGLARARGCPGRSQLPFDCLPYERTP